MHFTARCGLRKLFLICVACATLGQLCTSLIAQTVSITEYPVPTASFPFAIAAGPDGALWFTELSNKIGRITTAGVITEFPVPTVASQPRQISAGPDGALWFTEQAANKIGRITAAGAITEFPVPTAASSPFGIAAGPQGALWFTEVMGNKIGRITTSGVITEFSGVFEPGGITTGPDGALWFEELGANKIGRITTVGAITEFPLPTGSSVGLITAGPDGALWFTEQTANKIGRITTVGAITEFPVPTFASQPFGITAGPDGALWFAELAASRIGRITTAGAITEFFVPTVASFPYGITTGPDGALWFTESANNIGRAFPLQTSATHFVPVAPCRIADTRNAAGPFGGPGLPGQTSRDFVIPNSACGIPSTAVAYSLNVAVVPSGPLGYLTLWPAGQSQPFVATLNSIDGRVKSNAAIVPAGQNGAISVFATNATDVILDINGYFVAASNAGALAFYPVTPCRVADTRNATGPLGGPSLAAQGTRLFPILTSSCGVPATAQAYSLNFAAVTSSLLGYLTAWPAGQPQPLVASLNDPVGTVVANAVIVPAGTGGGVNVYSTNATDLVIDINGYFAPPGAGGLSLYTVAPCRVSDSRLPNGTPPFATTIDVNIAAGPCQVPSTAQAYVFNATAVPPGLLGYLTMWPQGQTQPLAATLNAYDGAVTNNMAIVPTTTGSISVYPSQPTHLVLDIFGYFAP